MTEHILGSFGCLKFILSIIVSGQKTRLCLVSLMACFRLDLSHLDVDGDEIMRKMCGSIQSDIDFDSTFSLVFVVFCLYFFVDDTVTTNLSWYLDSRLNGSRKVGGRERKVGNSDREILSKRLLIMPPTLNSWFT